MKKVLLVVCVLSSVAACEPAAPPVTAGSGVGFGDYSNYESERANREAELSGAASLIPSGEISDEEVAGSEDVATSTTDQAPNAPLSVTANNPGISDEQDFSAVAERESIESDAARIAAQRDAYELVQPGALPARTGKGGALVVEFALATTNFVGEKLYNRSSLSGQARYERNCAKYTSANEAQEAFLKAGGPERDRYGIDPDGDGFACFWDPTPFRLALGG